MMLSRKSCHSTFTRMMRVVIISIIILSIFDNWHVLFFGPWIKVHLSNLITYLIREKCHLILVQDTNAKSILQNFVTTSIKIALFVSFTRKVTYKSDEKCDLLQNQGLSSTNRIFRYCSTIAKFFAYSYNAHFGKVLINFLRAWPLLQGAAITWGK